MLILTRKTHQTIMIGDDIKVTVCAVQDGQVRIGISAPRDVEVHRSEIYDRIQEEQKGGLKRVG